MSDVVAAFPLLGDPTATELRALAAGCHQLATADDWLQERGCNWTAVLQLVEPV